MSHMVIYRGIDGKPGYHQTDDIHDAVGFVEQMRNEDGVEHARIFRLEEVVFEYRPYFRVELADLAGSDSPILADGVADGMIDVTDHASVDLDGEAVDGELPVEANGLTNGVAAEAGSKKGLFGR